MAAPMIKKLTTLIIPLLLVLCQLVGPTSIQAQGIQVVMQRNAVANGNGDTLNVLLQSTAVLTINCASCAGGTTINFEVTANSSDFVPVNGVQPNGTTASSSTTTAGITVWVIPVAGFTGLRARISGYLAGTVNITGIAVNGGASGLSTGGGAGSSVVTNAGTFAVQAGQAADGSPATGNPVRIAIKDGSGNTQDANGDTNGNLSVILPDGGDVTQGAKADTKCADANTSCSLVQLAKAVLQQAINTNALASTDPCFATAKSQFKINIATNATTVVSAASASNKWYACAFHLVVGAADNIALVEDATGSCASPDAGIPGGTTAATGWNLIANDKVALGSGTGTIMQSASTNVNVCLITSTSAQVSGTVEYVLAP